MQDLTCKVQAALEAYLFWGRAALESLVAERSEEFFARMERRDAAFSAFQKIDAAAGGTRPSGPTLKDLWLQIDTVNRVLQQRMTGMQIQSEHQRRRASHLRLVRSA